MDGDTWIDRQVDKLSKTRFRKLALLSEIERTKSIFGQKQSQRLTYREHDHYKTKCTKEKKISKDRDQLLLLGNDRTNNK